MTSITRLFTFVTVLASLPKLCVCPRFPFPVADTQPQYRYNEISLVYRAWVHMHIVKRGGGAHTHGGVASLADGSMAVECPACPHPGRNIDEDSLENE